MFTSMLLLSLLACNGITPHECKTADCDGDMLDAEDDCNNNNPYIGGQTTYYFDADGDGYGDMSPATDDQNCGGTNLYPDCVACAWDSPPPPDCDVCVYTGDCDDGNSDIHPAATEVCDVVDNDCDTQVDEDVTLTAYMDADGDNYGDPNTYEEACTIDTGFSADSTDCDDGAATINPSAAEVCDGVDNNCDGTVDEGFSQTWYQDADGDGYGDAAISMEGCLDVGGYVANNTDCDDSDVTVYPDAEELEDGIDNDCVSDEGDAPPTALTWENRMAEVEGYTPTSGLSGGCIQPTLATPYLIVIDRTATSYLFDSTLRGATNAISAPETRTADLASAPTHLRCNLNDVHGGASPDFALGAAGSSQVSVEDLDAGDSGDIAFFGESGDQMEQVISGLGTLILGLPGVGVVDLVGHTLYNGYSYDAGRVENIQVVGDGLFARSLASIDWNGDGGENLVVGGSGEVVVYDDQILTDSTPPVIAQVTSESLGFGAEVIAVADLSGDGVSELIVTDTLSGEIHVISGALYGVYPISDALCLTMTGEVGVDFSVTALDAIGGGTTGLAVGVASQDMVYVYNSEVLQCDGRTLSLDTSSATTVILGPTGTEFGAALSSGDLDQDGVSEVVITAPAYDGGRGIVYVIPLRR